MIDDKHTIALGYYLSIQNRLEECAVIEHEIELLDRMIHCGRGSLATGVVSGFY